MNKRVDEFVQHLKDTGAIVEKDAQKVKAVAFQHFAELEKETMDAIHNPVGILILLAIFFAAGFGLGAWLF